MIGRATNSKKKKWLIWDEQFMNWKRSAFEINRVVRITCWMNYAKFWTEYNWSKFNWNRNLVQNFSINKLDLMKLRSINYLQKSVCADNPIAINVAIYIWMLIDCLKLLRKLKFLSNYFNRKNHLIRSNCLRQQSQSWLIAFFGDGQFCVRSDNDNSNESFSKRLWLRMI